MAADNFRLTKEATLKCDSHIVPAMFGPLVQATMEKAPISFRDGDLISNLLTDAGFQISRHDAFVLERRF